MNSKSIKNHIKQTTGVLITTKEDIELPDLVSLFNALEKSLSDGKMKSVMAKDIVTRRGAAAAAKYVELSDNCGHPTFLDIEDNVYWDDIVFQFLYTKAGKEYTDLLIYKACHAYLRN